MQVSPCLGWGGRERERNGVKGIVVVEVRRREIENKTKIVYNK